MSDTYLLSFKLHLHFLFNCSDLYIALRVMSDTYLLSSKLQVD